MAKKSKTSFKKMKKETKDKNHREEYSKEFNQVIHNNPPLEVTKQRGTQRKAFVLLCDRAKAFYPKQFPIC